MNREQKRAANRMSRNNHKAIDKHAAATFIENKLRFANTEPHTDEDTTEIMAHYYASLVRLTNAVGFDQDDFELLTVMMNCGFNIGRKLHQAGDFETRKALAQTLPVFEAASAALEAIGNRRSSKGKWGATGDDLQALRNLAGVIEQLMNVSTRGIVAESLTAAKMAVTLNRQEVH